MKRLSFISSLEFHIIYRVFSKARVFQNFLARLEFPQKLKIFFKLVIKMGSVIKRFSKIFWNPECHQTFKKKFISRLSFFKTSLKKCNAIDILERCTNKSSNFVKKNWKNFSLEISLLIHSFQTFYWLSLKTRRFTKM